MRTTSKPSTYAVPERQIYERHLRVAGPRAFQLVKQAINIFLALPAIQTHGGLQVAEHILYAEDPARDDAEFVLELACCRDVLDLFEYDMCSSSLRVAMEAKRVNHPSLRRVVVGIAP